MIEGFSDDYYVVEADRISALFRHIWLRYPDPTDNYLISMKGPGPNVTIYRVKDGTYPSLGSAGRGPIGTIRVRIYDDNGTDTIGVYNDGVLKLTVSDSEIPYGGVAFGSPQT